MLYTSEEERKAREEEKLRKLQAGNTAMQQAEDMFGGEPLTRGDRGALEIQSESQEDVEMSASPPALQPQTNDLFSNVDTILDISSSANQSTEVLAGVDKVFTSLPERSLSPDQEKAMDNYSVAQQVSNLQGDSEEDSGSFFGDVGDFVANFGEVLIEDTLNLPNRVLTLGLSAAIAYDGVKWDLLGFNERAEESYAAAKAVEDFMKENEIDLIDTEDNQSGAGTAGAVAGTLVSLVTAGGLASKAIKIPEITRRLLIGANVKGKYLKNLTAFLSTTAAGEIGAQLVIDPEDPLLVNAIADWVNPDEVDPAVYDVLSALSTDPTDLDTVNRLRLLVEGGALSAVVSGVGHGVAKAAKSDVGEAIARSVKKSGMSIKELGDSVVNKWFKKIADDLDDPKLMEEAAADRNFLTDSPQNDVLATEQWLIEKEGFTVEQAMRAVREEKMSQLDLSSKGTAELLPEPEAGFQVADSQVSGVNQVENSGPIQLGALDSKITAEGFDPAKYKGKQEDITLSEHVTRKKPSDLVGSMIDEDPSIGERLIIRKVLENQGMAPIEAYRVSTRMINAGALERARYFKSKTGMTLEEFKVKETEYLPINTEREELLVAEEYLMATQEGMTPKKAMETVRKQARPDPDAIVAEEPLSIAEITGKTVDEMREELFNKDPIYKRRIMVRDMLEEQGQNPSTAAGTATYLARQEADTFRRFIKARTGLSWEEYRTVNQAPPKNTDMGGQLRVDNASKTQVSDIIENVTDTVAGKQIDNNSNTQPINNLWSKVIAAVARSSHTIDNLTMKTHGFNSEAVVMRNVVESPEEIDTFFYPDVAKRLKEIHKKGTKEEFVDAVTSEISKSGAVVADQKANVIHARRSNMLDPGANGRVVLPAEIGKADSRLVMTEAKSLGNIQVENGFDIEEFEDFLLWVQHKRAKASDKPSVLRIDEAARTRSDKLIAAGDANKQYRKAAREFGELMQTTLQYAKRSGVVSSEGYARMVASASKDYDYYNYIPLTVDPEQLTKLTGKSSSRGSASQVAELKGNVDVPLENPLIATVKYIDNMLVKSEANREKQAIFKMIDDASKNGNEFAKGVAEKIDMREVLKDKAARANIIETIKKKTAELKKRGVETEIDEANFKGVREGSSEEAEAALTRLLQELPEIGEFTIGQGRTQVVLRDGKMDFYNIKDEDLLTYFRSEQSPRTLTAVSKNLANDPIVKWLAKGAEIGLVKPAKVMAEFIVRSPAFVAVNYVREGLIAPVNSAFSFLPFRHTVEGMKQMVFDQEVLREAVAGGMSGSARIDTLGKTYRQLAARGADYKEGLISRNMKKIQSSTLKMIARKGTTLAGKGLSAMDSIVRAFENSSRLAEYSIGRKRGYVPEIAALMGNEVSTNFLKRGNSATINTIMDASMFLSPTIQAMHKFAKSARRRPVLFTSSVLTYAALDYQMEEVGNQFDEYRYGLNEYDKGMNFIIPNILEGSNPDAPELDPETPFIALPLPHELGGLAKVFNGIYRGLAEHEDDQVYLKVKESVGRFLENATPSIGTPTAFKPIIDTWWNEDDFGNKIVPEYLENEAATPFMTKARTSEMAKMLSRVQANLIETFTGARNETFVHPLVLDHIIKGYSVGLLRGGLNAIDSLARDEEQGELPASRLGGDSIDVNPVSWSINSTVDKFAIDAAELRGYMAPFYEVQRKAKDYGNKIRSYTTANELLEMTDDIFNTEMLLIPDEEELLVSLGTSDPISRRTGQLLRKYQVMRTQVANRGDITPDQKRVEIDDIDQKIRRTSVSYIRYIERVDPKDSLDKFIGVFDRGSEN